MPSGHDIQTGVSEKHKEQLTQSISAYKKSMGVIQKELMSWWDVNGVIGPGVT